MIYRIRRYDELGDPEPVELSKAEIKKLEVFDHRWWDGGLCPVGRCKTTSEVYLLEPVERYSAPPMREGRAAPRQRGLRAPRHEAPGVAPPAAPQAPRALLAGGFEPVPPAREAPQAAGPKRRRTSKMEWPVL